MHVTEYVRTLTLYVHVTNIFVRQCVPDSVSIFNVRGFEHLLFGYFLVDTF